MLFLHAQPSCQEQVQRFAVAARGGEDAAQRQEYVGHRAGLLLQLPEGAGDGVLTGVQLAGGQLQKGLAEHIAILGDSQHAVPLVQRQHGHAVHMVRHLPDGGLAVGQQHRVHMNIHQNAVVFVLTAELLFFEIFFVHHAGYTSYLF